MRLSLGVPVNVVEKHQTLIQKIWTHWQGLEEPNWSLKTQTMWLLFSRRYKKLDPGISETIEKLAEAQAVTWSKVQNTWLSVSAQTPNKGNSTAIKSVSEENSTLRNVGSDNTRETAFLNPCKMESENSISNFPLSLKLQIKMNLLNSTLASCF